MDRVSEFPSSYPEEGDFATLLRWHLDWGSRPDGTPSGPGQRWSRSEFAHAVGELQDPDSARRNVRNWLSGNFVPRNVGLIEQALFGGNRQYDRWRYDLRRAIDRAKQRAPWFSANLPSLTRTQENIDHVEAALTRGLQANDSLDNPEDYFASRSLDQRGDDLRRLLGTINHADDRNKIPTSLPTVPPPLVLARSVIELAEAQRYTELIQTLATDPYQLRNLSPRQFEELSAELLHRMGHEVELTPAQADGGYDIAVRINSELGRQLLLVECKRYTHKPVGVGVLRSLLGVVADKKASSGLVVALSSFTRGARAFVAQNEYQLALADFEHLKTWLTVKSLGNR